MLNRYLITVLTLLSVNHTYPNKIKKGRGCLYLYKPISNLYNSIN